MAGRREGLCLTRRIHNLDLNIVSQVIVVIWNFSLDCKVPVAVQSERTGTDVFPIAAQGICDLRCSQAVAGVTKQGSLELYLVYGTVIDPFVIPYKFICRQHEVIHPEAPGIQDAVTLAYLQLVVAVALSPLEDEVSGHGTETVGNQFFGIYLPSLDVQQAGVDLDSCRAVLQGIHPVVQDCLEMHRLVRIECGTVRDKEGAQFFLVRIVNVIFSKIGVMVAGAADITLLIFVHHVCPPGTVANLQQVAYVSSKPCEAVRGIHCRATYLFILIFFNHHFNFSQRFSSLVVGCEDIVS